MKRLVGYLSCLAVLLIATPSILVSAHYLERAVQKPVNATLYHPGPEHIDRMPRIDLKYDMAANLPRVEVPVVDLGEVANWLAPERVDVVLAPNLPLSLTVYMDSHWTRDEYYVTRDFFRPAETVYWVIGIQNDSGADASVTAIWDIDYPDGSSVFYSNPTWTVPAGYSAWQYNGIVSSIGGMYTFFASVDYLADHSEGTRNYWVMPFQCYLPVVQR